MTEPETAGPETAGPGTAGPELHNRLRALRRARGLTQADLAAAVGVSRKTVNTVENRVFIPSALLALKLARALGTPVEEVFALEPFQPLPEVAPKGERA